MLFPAPGTLKRALGDLSLRTKFQSALLLAVLIPLLLVSLFFSGMYVDISTRNARGLLRDKLHIARLAMDNTRTEILNLNKTIASEAMMPINLGLYLYPPISQHLENLIDQQHLAFATVLDEQGTMVARAPQPDSLPSGLKPLEPGVLSAALQSGGTSYYTVMSKDDFVQAKGLSLKGQEQLLCLVSLVPIKDHADILLGYSWIGILLGPEDINSKHRILNTLPAELEVPYLFVGPRGLISASFKETPPHLPEAKKIMNSLSQALESRMFNFDSTGTTWQSAFLPLPGIDEKPVAALGIALPDTDLVQTRNMSILFLALAALLVFGMSIIIARFLARVLARPILDVAAGTKQIINGDFDISIKVHGHDEIGQMAEDFTVMSLQLKKLISELNREVEEHSRAETYIRTLNDDLEDRVQTRTMELTLANQALTESLDLLKKTQSDLIESEKMAALNTLVAGVAHEINTPLGNCVTAISFLEKCTLDFANQLQNSELTRSDLDGFIQKVRNVGELSSNGLRKAADLVSFFKQVAVAPEEEQPVILNLNRYCEELLASMHLRTLHPGLEFHNGIDPSMMVKTLPGALYRTLSNLLGNAISHAFKQGQPGMETPFQPGISLSGFLEGSQAVIQVSDNGCGMSTEIAERIFEPFFTTARSKGHVGLGLAITYNLVHKSLSGSISCKTLAGKGSTFTIRLPSNDGFSSSGNGSPT